MGTGISIARSQVGNAPPDGGLANGELAYSFSSNKLWIGQTDTVDAPVTNEYIGGKLLVDKVANLESTLFGATGLEVGQITITNTASIDTLILNTGLRNGVLFRQGNGEIGFATGTRGQFLTYDGNGDISFASSLDGFEVQSVAIFEANVEIDGVLLSDNDVYANNVFIRSNLQVNGDIILRGDNINIGDGGDVINLGASVNSSIIPTTSNTQNLGSVSQTWGTVYANQFVGDASLLTGIVTTANSILLGGPSEDANITDGAVKSLTSGTSTLDAIDRINEAMFNIHKNTFVRDINFSAEPSAGGAGTTVELTISVTEGNPNSYDIDWGDGSWTNNTVDTTPTHLYATNVGSPFDISVYARNTNGYGEGSNTSLTKTDFITIYTADPVVGFNLFNSFANAPGLEANTGENVYLRNTTTNIANDETTASFSINWGDGSALVSVPSKVDTGGPQGNDAIKTYANGSGSSSFNVILSQLTHSTATPSIFPLTGSQTIKVFDLGISPPDNLSTKTISFATPSKGNNPALAVGYIYEDGYSAGDTIHRIRPDGGTTSTTEMTSYFHTANTSTVYGKINKVVSNNDPYIIDETGVDYYNYNAAGQSVSAANRIFAKGLFTTGTKARWTRSNDDFLQNSLTSISLTSEEGDTNLLHLISDTLAVTPTVDVSNSSIIESGSPTYNYVSGVPYYESGETLTATNISVNNLVAKTYAKIDAPFQLTVTPTEGSGGAVTQTYTYAQALEAADRVDNIPRMDLYSVDIEDLDISIGSGSGSLEFEFVATNVNGSNTGTLSSDIVQVFTGTPTLNELSIPVSDSLGAGFDSDGLRLSGFTGATPTFSGSTDYMSTAFWSEPVTVAGTDEAIIRYNELKHFDTDLSSGYLPVGPNLATGRSGTQYFRFAFKRTTVSNIRFRMTGKVSGFYIAAPGTAIDSASGLNGWLDAGIQYAGSGVPGSDTANGGNGSNGCASTGADIIVDGTTYNNQAFDLTLGTENLSNAYSNQMLVTIALNSGDYLTAISVEAVT